MCTNLTVCPHCVPHSIRIPIDVLAERNRVTDTRSSPSLRANVYKCLASLWSVCTSPCNSRASLVARMVKKRPAMRGPGFEPWVGKIPWRWEWQSTPVFLPGESHGQRGLAGTVHRVSKSWTGLSEFHLTKHVTIHAIILHFQILHYKKL